MMEAADSGGGRTSGPRPPDSRPARGQRAASPPAPCSRRRDRGRVPRREPDHELRATAGSLPSEHRAAVRRHRLAHQREPESRPVRTRREVRLEDAVPYPLGEPAPVVRDHDLDQLLRSEEHTSELQSRENLVCRLLLEKKQKTTTALDKEKRWQAYQVVCDNNTSLLREGSINLWRIGPALPFSTGQKRRL